MSGDIRGPRPDDVVEVRKNFCVIYDPDATKKRITGKGKIRDYVINLPEGSSVPGFGMVRRDNFDLWNALNDGLVDEDGRLTAKGIEDRKGVIGFSPKKRAKGSMTFGEMKKVFNKTGPELDRRLKLREKRNGRKGQLEKLEDSFEQDMLRNDGGNEEGK